MNLEDDYKETRRVATAMLLSEYEENWVPMLSERNDDVVDLQNHYRELIRAATILGLKDLPTHYPDGIEISDVIKPTLSIVS